ncbi:MAG TPA: aspartate carbamoyltransferase [Verrucomicrobiae bacterium]|nr:aspartate carbamoyltransferase [Verrucomicrobiae bacterium]
MSAATVGTTVGVRHVVSAQQFDRPRLEALFAAAREMERVLAAGGDDRLRGRLLATLFYEPSTRTRLSFESAMLRLGGQVVSTENARDFSSAIKGESLEDSVRIVAGYADAIVLRHPEEGAAARAAAVAPVPILNAGDGPGEHPTQSLLDLYTIERELGRVDGLRVVMVGDLAHGRTVHSLAQLLAGFEGVRLTLAAPAAVRMRTDVLARLRAQGADIVETDDLLAALRDADVVYQTRLQRERFGADEAAGAAAARIAERFRITPDVMASLGAHAIVLHPLPRVGEIDPAVDADPRAAYFRQAHNGVAVRMALLAELLA